MRMHGSIFQDYKHLSLSENLMLVLSLVVGLGLPVATTAEYLTYARAGAISGEVMISLLVMPVIFFTCLMYIGRSGVEKLHKTLTDIKGKNKPKHLIQKYTFFYYLHRVGKTSCIMMTLCTFLLVALMWIEGLDPELV